MSSSYVIVLCVAFAMVVAGVFQFVRYRSKRAADRIIRDFPGKPESRSRRIQAGKIHAVFNSSTPDGLLNARI